MAGRFVRIGGVFCAALALCVWAVAAFALPALAGGALRSALRDIGFPQVSIEKIEAGFRFARFRTIALDPDSLSSIGAIEVSFSPADLLATGKIREILVSDLVLTADYSSDAPPSLAGWGGSYTGHGGSFSGHEPPFERMTLRNARLDVATDSGGIGLTGDVAATVDANGDLAFQSKFSAAQYQASFDLTLSGALEKSGNWSLAAQIAEGKLAFDGLKVSRISGWIDAKSGEKDGPPSLTGQIAAGSIMGGLVRLQELTATLEGTPQSPKISLDGKAAGVPGLTLRATMENGAIEADIAAREPSDLADYLRLAAEAAGQKLDPALIPQRFSGVNLRVTRGPESADAVDASRRFTLALSDSEETLSLHSDLLWNPKERSLSGLFETGTIPAALAFRLFPSVLPQGWRARGGSLNGQGQFTATFAEGGAKISGPANILLDDLDLENEEGSSVSGLSGRLIFESLVPAATKGFQKLTAARADAGLPLESVQARVKIGSDGSISVHDASAILAGGSVRLEDSSLRKGRLIQPTRVHLENIDLARAARLYDAKALAPSGLIDGTLTLSPGPAGRIDLSGALESRAPGGEIRYDPDPVPAFLAGSDPGLETARVALRDFRYETFGVTLEGTLGGDLRAGLSAKGTSPSAFGQRPIELNLTVEGAVLPLFRLSHTP